MRLLAFILCFVVENAYAKDFVVSAKSGQSTTMHIYRSWTNDCKSKLGVVKVLSKPSHGRLTRSEVTAPIGISRNSPEETAHCKGVLTNGFRVDYISSPGFRGTDQFQIQFTYGRHVDIDNYTVNVQQDRHVIPRPALAA
jgi:hypothetical protein